MLCLRGKNKNGNVAIFPSEEESQKYASRHNRKCKIILNVWKI
jgi:hypothetical protein